MCMNGSRRGLRATGHAPGGGFPGNERGTILVGVLAMLLI